MNPLSTQELLKPENMIRLYAQGAFPMANEYGEINWYLPQTRAIIPLDNYNYPRSLRKFVEESQLQYRFDSDPEEVVRQCADREETWITDDLITAYKGLMDYDFIHSVEVFEKEEMIGGLYGVVIGGAFFGESMFSKKSQASKAALITLIERLVRKNFALLDVQFMTDHLRMFGAVEITFAEFQELLKVAYSRNTEF
jgi:leucyl/phenylalanyl-tRNA--protein transferase